MQVDGRSQSFSSRARFWRDRARSKAPILVALFTAALAAGGFAFAIARGHSKAPPPKGPQTMAEYHALCETRFRESKANLSSTNDERTLRERLAKLTQPVDVRSVECRSSMCRIEVLAPDRQKFVREGFGTPATVWGGETLIAPAGEGVVVYIAREGHALPSS